MLCPDLVSDSYPVLQQVTLQDHVEIAGGDSEAITTLLEGKVEQMIHKASRRVVGGQEAMLPLIRLRVCRKNMQAEVMLFNELQSIILSQVQDICRFL